MRKVLNILESCSLAHKTITMANVFEVTGRPSPNDVDTIYEALSMKRYNEALDILMEIKHNKSLALEDLVNDLHKCLMKTKLADEMKLFLISRLAEIEYRMAQGSSEKI